jgi:hypothetical protein
MVARFREIASRVNGISCPIFGVSWSPPVLDRDVARSIVAFLEDRRVLYEPSEVEVRSHCIDSVLQIRQTLTDALRDGRIAEDLADHLRAMRAACRRFLEAAGSDRDSDLWSYRDGVPGLHDWRLNQALGELRGTFGVHVAQIAVKYGIDVEDRLAAILPPSD